MAKMETLGKRSLIWTGVGICVISCCIQCIMGDVPDGFVYTDLLKTIPRGSTAVLKCEFFGPPLAVYWKKGDDPTQVSTLVTWMDEKIWPGSCAEDNSCEMGDDNSLIIRDAQIENEGRYICRVSNHQGILIHNFTDLKVFEPPREPYPVINQCNDSSSLETDYGCDIPTLSHVNLTCSASRFFPDLDLFFLHGTEKIASKWTNEWTNNDGTRSKSVTINAAPKETPYVCVASDVPGNQKERAMTVFVRLLHLDTSTASTWFTPLPSKELNVVIIIVAPIVFVTLAGVCILIACWRKHRRQCRIGHGQEEGSPLLELMTIKGKLSFYDIWMMLSRVTTSETEKMNDTLYELGRQKLVKGSKPLEAYQDLCQWKTDNAHADQADILKKALDKSSYHEAWEKIWGLQSNSAIVLSEGTLKHILWHIGEPGKINKFLSELIPGRPTTHFEVTDEMSKLVRKSLRELKEWSVRTTDKNPVLLLSLALERAGYSPLDRTFFCVSDLPVSHDEVHDFVQVLARRHCSRLAKLAPYEIESIVEENNNDLFDTESMISDWVAQENGSHIDKRCKLNHAAISIGRYDLKGYLVGYDSHVKLSDTGKEEHTGHTKITRSTKGQGNHNLGNDLSDAEIRRMDHYLSRAQLTEMIGEHAEPDSFNAIKAWMERESSVCQPGSCRQCLRENLSQIGMEVLIPLEIEEGVCLVELVDVAFRLMMTDIYPLAKALGISADKLKSYKRQTLDKSKPRGTMGVLVRLGKKTNYARRELCNVLAQEAGFQEMAHLLKYGYELSRSDLCAVGYGFGSGKELCCKISKNLGIVTEETFTMNMLSHWRSLVESPTYNPRTALADAVFPILGKEKARGIISGDIRCSDHQKRNVIPFIRDSIEHVQAFHLASVIGVQQSSSEKGELSIMHVLEMWRQLLKNQPLKDNQRGELCKRLADGGFKTFSSKLHDVHLLQNVDILKEMKKAIGHDVAGNVSDVLDEKVEPFEGTLTLTQVLEEWNEKLRGKTLNQQGRILLSNRLYEEGYKDFSFEVMIGY